MPWTVSLCGTHRNQSMEARHTLALGQLLDPSAWRQVILHERLEGHFFRKGKRFWFSIVDNVGTKCMSENFGGSLKGAKSMALTYLINRICQIKKDLGRVQRQATLEWSKHESTANRRRRKANT